jgi:hypothetical protein
MTTPTAIGPCILITNGPSREQLFDALRLYPEGRTVILTVSNPDPNRGSAVFHVQVQSIGINDGSGERWFLKLYDPDKRFGSRYLHAHYHTNHRKGNMAAIIWPTF